MSVPVRKTTSRPVACSRTWRRMLSALRTACMAMHQSDACRASSAVTATSNVCDSRSAIRSALTKLPRERGPAFGQTRSRRGSGMMWGCIRQNLLLCASVGLQRRGEERTIAPLSRPSSLSRFHDPTTPTAVGLAPWRDPRGLGLGRRPRQLPALPRPGSPERWRLVHDPLLPGAAAARHPDRLGRMGHGALRRPQGIPFCARNHGRGRQGLHCALSRRDRRADPARRLLLLHPDRELVPRICVRLLRERRHRDRRNEADRGPDQDRERPLRFVHGRQLRWRHARRQAARVRRVLGDRLRDQRHARLPRHQQGHREVLQLGDASDGGLRARRARSRADAGRAGCCAS